MRSVGSPYLTKATSLVRSASSEARLVIIDCFSVCEEVNRHYICRWSLHMFLHEIIVFTSGI